MEKIAGLHSLRGVAAATVVLSHLFLTFPAAIEPINIKALATWAEPATWLRYSPLRALVGGRPAVVFFFVLSAFVLTLSLEKAGGRTRYWPFVKRRLARIYLPFMVSVLFAALLASLVPTGPVAGLSTWFNDKSWIEPVSLPLVLKHLSMWGSSEAMSLNNVMWSLVHELRISLIFPFLLLALMLRTWLAFVVLTGMSVLAALVGRLLAEGSAAQMLADTVYYIQPFVLGILLALKRETVGARVAALSPRVFLALVGLAILLFAVPPGVRLAEAGYEAGALFSIAAVIYRPEAKRVMENAFFVWLGKISYSLYLFHLPVILLAFHLFYGKLPSALIVVLTLPVILAVSELAFRFVETPAMALGRRITA